MGKQSNRGHAVRRSAEQGQALLNQWRQSGLSRSEFCRRQALGATRFADQLSLVSTADAAGVNPGSYIADILPRINSWPHSKLHELLPHVWATAGEPVRARP